MASRQQQEKIAKFQEYNFKSRSSNRQAPQFHDNDLKSVKILLPEQKQKPGIVEFIVIDRWESIERVLILKGCANLQSSIDFDILADNTSSPKSSAGVTSNIEMSDCSDSIKRLVEQAQSEWNVEYPPNKHTPATYKLSQRNEFIVVRIILHGGTLEILARDFEVSDRKLS